MLEKRKNNKKGELIKKRYYVNIIVILLIILVSIGLISCKSDDLISDFSSDDLISDFSIDKLLDGSVYYHMITTEDNVIYFLYDGKTYVVTANKEPNEIHTDVKVNRLLCVDSNEIYFEAYDGLNSIYKIEADGSNEIKLFEEDMNSAAIMDDYIYYSKRDITDKDYENWYYSSLYKIKIDGTDKTKLNEYECESIKAYDNTIYFIESKERCVYDYDDEKTKLYSFFARTTEVDYTGYSIYDNFIYYIDYEDKNLYKIKIENPIVVGSNEKNRIKLTDIYCDAFFIIDDWIYFSGSEEIFERPLTHYKMKTDGTGFCIIDN